MSGRPTDGDIPPAKKRSSDRQITKDDADDDSDVEEEVDPNNFQRASDDVLKQRKIVRARRGAGGAPVASETPASGNPFAGIQLQAPKANPFSGISLVPPSQGGAAAGISEADKPDAAAAAGKPDVAAVPSTAQDTSAPAAVREEPPPAAPSTKGTTAAPPPGSGGIADSFLGAPAAGGFAALASSAPAGAFGGGVGGFGAAAAAGTNVFRDNAAKPAALGSASGPPPFSFAAAAPAAAAANGASTGFTFPTLAADKANGSAQPSAAAGKASAVRSIFAAPTGHMNAEEGGSKDAAAAAVALGPVETAKTGEEDENTVFSGEGVLFEFDASKEWRERGRGDMKVNVSKETGAARMVMRQKGNLRLLMNAALFAEMSITRMEGGKAVTFVCMNGAAHAADGSDDSAAEGAKEGAQEGEKAEQDIKAEGQDAVEQGPGAAKLTTWAFRIKPKDRLEEFEACLLTHRGTVHSKAEGAEEQV